MTFETKKYLKKITGLFVSFALLWPPNLYALPQDAKAVSGTATFEQVNDNTLNITASHQSIIEYTSFDVGASETVNFILPSLDSISMNRILSSGDGSQIMGTLTANGNIFLIDTLGFHFGSSSQLNVGGLIASTRDISNTNFLAGNYIFGSLGEGEFSQIINEGLIETADGGFAVLIGSNVINEGTIRAPLGTVSLASGDVVTVGLSNDGLVSIAVDDPVSAQVLDKDGNVIADQISNAGTLQANGGQVLIEADHLNNLFEQAVNLEGHIKANQAVLQNGQVKIIAGGNAKIAADIEADTGSIEIVANDIEFTGSNNIRAATSRVQAKEDLIINAGVMLNGNNTTFEVAGDWVNQGTFNPGTSTVDFYDASLSSTIYNNNTFYNFTTTTPSKKLFFEAGKTQTALNDFTTRGVKFYLVELRSTDTGNAQWMLEAQGTTDMSFVHLGDAHNIRAEAIKTLPSNSFGNNTNFDTDPVWQAVAAGNWSVPGNWDTGVIPGSADTVTFNATSSQNSFVDVPFTITTLNVTNAYTGTVTLNAALTVLGNASLSSGTGSFNTNGLTLTVNGNLSNTSGSTLQVGTSTINVGGDFTLGGTGNFNGGSGTINLDGNFTNNIAGFTAGSSTFNFVGGDQTLTGNTSFANFTKTTTTPVSLTFGSGATFNFSGALQLTGSGSNHLCIRASIPGVAFNLTPAAGVTLNTVSFQDTGFTVPVTATNSVQPTVAPNNTNITGLTSQDVSCVTVASGGGGSGSLPPGGDTEGGTNPGFGDHNPFDGGGNDRGNGPTSGGDSGGPNRPFKGGSFGEVFKTGGSSSRTAVYEGSVYVVDRRGRVSIITHDEEIRVGYRPKGQLKGDFYENFRTPEKFKTMVRGTAYVAYRNAEDIYSIYFVSEKTGKVEFYWKKEPVKVDKKP